MAVTTNLNLTLLEVGQKEKEVTINTNMSLIDAAVPKFLGQFASDPSPTGKVVGSTYWNTGSTKLRVLIDSTTWVNAA